MASSKHIYTQVTPDELSRLYVCECVHILNSPPPVANGHSGQWGVLTFLYLAKKHLLSECKLSQPRAIESTSDAIPVTKTYSQVCVPHPIQTSCRELRSAVP